MKNCLILSILVGFLGKEVTSFSPTSRVQYRVVVCPNKSVSLYSWQDKLKELFALDDNKQKVQDPKTTIGESATGTVVRLAARTYDSKSSKPSSREYTTRKDEFSSVRVTNEGVEGDYNHYRTVALKATEDRAVSILTLDVMNSIRATYKNYKPKEGDLGENILVDGLPFGFFRVGQRYVFESSSKNQDASDDAKERVVVEITEPIEPCANLCKLPYINDDSISPKERIERCKDFIDYLDRVDGYRGWYAKVHEAGVIRTGALVSIVQKEKQ